MLMLPAPWYRKASCLSKYFTLPQTLFYVHCCPPPLPLQVVRVPLPSFLSNVDVRQAGLPPQLSAYASGALFALAASPCSTPVLASLLAFAATQVRVRVYQ